jgi:hypothetical protein
MAEPRVRGGIRSTRCLAVGADDTHREADRPVTKILHNNRFEARQRGRDAMVIVGVDAYNRTHI